LPVIVPLGKQLFGRVRECAIIDQLLTDGQGGVLVISGEAGVGKTVLLEYAIERGRELEVRGAWTSGVAADVEFPFAAIQELCFPFLDLLKRLPQPQREALSVGFGLTTGTAPNHFLVGLAVLGLLSEAAEEQPLVLVVDDAHWLDSESVQVLAFVARRLLADKIVMLFATRHVGALSGLPDLPLTPLQPRDARALLESALPALQDETVIERIVVETRGNPLALLEMPRGLTSMELAGGFGIAAAVPMSAGIEEAFRRRMGTLSDDARRFLLVAAADPTGDPLLLRRAIEKLQISPDAAAACESEGLLRLGEQVTFRHPLVRSAVYSSSSMEQRRTVHLALAAATDPISDADRRAWHLAAGASPPDEEVAAELERSASRAQARGGLTAAAAFLHRSLTLTGDPALRVDRALAAARASLYAGLFDDSLTLLSIVDASSPNERNQAEADLLRGQIAFSSNIGSDAPPLLLSAAKRLERLDVDVARETYLDAWGAAWFAGSQATAGDLREVSRAVRSAPPSTHPTQPFDLLLDALALLITEGRRTAAPLLRRASSAFVDAEDLAETSFRWTALPPIPSYILWDEEDWYSINARQLALARHVGALARLPMGLITGAVLDAWSGDFGKAAEATAEADAIVESTGTRLAPYAAMLLEALVGRETDGFARIQSAIDEASAVGQGFAVQWGEFVQAILFNGLGRYEEALIAAQKATKDTPELFISSWALAELIEAASRSVGPEHAADALERLTEHTAVAGTDWGTGIAARSRALLTEGDAAEALYIEAIERLGRTRLRPELGRAHLLYGEWLRRRSRRQDAQTQLRIAHEMFANIGMQAFAERARAELKATGERTRTPTLNKGEQLTPQEAQVARLATQGHTNKEIAAQLFISAATVEYHLGKVFRKLGVKSRTQLALHEI
jgi:DNA-binding CsgD family transcriptional regulator